MSVIQPKDQTPQTVLGPVVPGHRPAQAATMGGMTGRDVLRILHRRKWLILTILLVFMVITVIGTWLWKTYLPFYKADALIEVIPARNNILGVESGGAMAPEIMERQVAQFAQLIRRPVVLIDALKDPEVLQTGWYAKYGGGADPVKRLNGELDISPIPKTNLIRISMTSPLIEDVATIVNAVAQSAVDDTRTQRKITKTVELDEVIKELNSCKEQRDKRVREIGGYLVEGSTSSLESRQDSLRIRLADLLPKFQKQRSEQNDADKKLKLLNAQLTDPNRVMEIEEVGVMLRMDPSLASLRSAKMNYQAQLDDLLSRGFGKDHRAVQKLEGMIKSIQTQEMAATKEIVEKAVQMAMGTRTAELARATDSLGQMQEQSDQIDTEAREVAQKLAKVAEAKDEIAKLDKNIERYESKRQEMVLAVRMAVTAEIRGPALKPKKDTPDRPKWGIMLPVGTILGLVVGLGLAFLFELVDTSIKSPSDISRRLDLPLLGMVPHEDDTEEDIKDLCLACLNHPASLFSESFRQIRTCLMFSGPADRRRSLLVTSPQPGDGRTVVTMNLGTAIAASGRKVLIVDANFRQPMIRKLFPQVPAAGLSSAVTDQAPWRELVCQVAENLYVMASGPLPPNPAELLHSDLMRKLIAEMTAEYDQVIFDGAPALVVTDAPVLSTIIDGVVMVVRAGSNTHGIVQRARDTFARVGAHMVGIVLNGVRVSAGGYLRKNYETFYEYQTPAQLPPQ